MAKILAIDYGNKRKCKLVIRCKLIQTATTFFILKAYTIQSLSQTKVQMSQCRQSLSEIVGYHRDLVEAQAAKEIEGKAN